MPARRANNYALLSQSVDSVEPAERHRLNYEYAHHQRFLQQQTHVQTHYSLPDRLYSDQSAEKGPFVFEHDRSPWHPAAAAAARVSSGGGGGLQRQSSGSSYGESSLSSDYPLPTLTISPSASLHACDSAAFFNGLYENTGTAVDRDRNNSGNNKNNAPRNSTGNGIGNGNVGCGKNWAQQTEESYHLQLALALRVSADASSSEDPHFLGDYVHERRSGSGGRPSPASASHMAQDLSHRFWVTGCLSYYDRIPNGFYYICGMNPFVWTMCNDLKENRMPSLESLKSVDASDSSFEVILIDKKIDPFLKELETKALKIAFGSGNTQEVVVQELAKLVCWHLGGTASIEDEKLTRQWDSASKILRSCLESIVFPIGSLSMGLCRHRSLLFKVLADSINFRCRIARGCRYCKRDDGSSCIIQYGNDREYVVDLIGRPGVLSEPDSFLNGPSSLMVASPLRLPELKPSLFNEELGYLITKYKHDFRSLDIGIKAQATETSINSGPATVASVPQSESSITGFEQPPETLASPVQAMIHSFISGPAKMPNTATSSSLLNEKGVTNDSGHPGVQLGFPKVARALKDVRREEEVSLAKEGLEIPWSELELKERIGQGSFGTVYHADWRKSDVAVKILSELDFHDERLKEYLREVAIMKRLRHPNVVLFMGAVLSPKLAIVTEYLPRGSLYRLIHRHGVREHLNERRRLRMALDVATGMNYLHQLSPPIVHRDLKSPNLLVDKSWTVKVCDFGLSRLKANTFLSSKSAAGTPEWMAPEVLRDEPSNEKSDVYSFGVILWELITLQQPWSSLNPAQVVGAVGFQNRRLPIPKDVSPEIATIIESCWANDPRKRPSFATIMDSLKLLVKLPTLHPSQGGEH